MKQQSTGQRRPGTDGAVGRATPQPSGLPVRHLRPLATSQSHGGADAEPEGPTPLEQAQAEARRAASRYRRQLLPLAAIGATHAIGYAADAATGIAAAAALGAGAGTAAAWYGRAHRHATRWNRMYAAVAALVSLGWQFTAALAGTSGLLSALLWLGGSVLALPYWLRHAEPDPDVTAENNVQQPPPASPAPPSPTAPDSRTVAWGRHLGASGKPLARSTLSDLTEIPYGWRGTVDLPVGEHWTKIAEARRAILSVYDLPDGRAFVEPMPGESVRQARVTVLTVDPLEQTRLWPGPGLDVSTGTFPLMTTADGDTLPFRLWYPGGGACHALVAGATGSGKSAALDLILAELAFSDRYIPWIVDGGEGASNPDWADSATVPLVATTPADARRLLRYALRVAKRRKRYLRANKLRSIDPTPAMPGIGIVIDEAHNFLMGEDNADLKRIVEILTQEGRKVAMSVILATQVPSAAQLGGSTVIRNMLKSGTVVGFRTLEKTAANMAGGDQPLPEPLDKLPAEFPDGSPTRGLGYMLTSRLIRARALFYDPPRWAGTDVPVTGLDPWTGSVTPPQLVGDDEEGTDLDAVLDTTSPVPELPNPAVSSADEAQAVRQALEAGAAHDLAALMSATGLPMGAVRRALAQLN